MVILLRYSKLISSAISQNARKFYKFLGRRKTPLKTHEIGEIKNRFHGIFVFALMLPAFSDFFMEKNNAEKNS